MLGGLNPGLGLAILRIALGVIFLMHGGPRLLGGIDETAAFLGSAGLPVPTLAAWAVALLETSAGLLLLVGYLVSPAAVLLILQKTLGLFIIHLPQGFYVTGRGTGGIEFNLLLIAGLTAVLFAGPGHATLQGRLQKDVTVA